MFDSVVLFGTWAVLLSAPLAFGAVEPWAILGLEIGSSCLLMAWAVRQMLYSRLQITWSPIFAPMVGFSAILAAQIALHRSAYLYATSSGAMLYCVYGLLAFLVVQTLRRSAQVRHLGAAISLYGLSVAVFALIQSLSSGGKLYWMRAPRTYAWIYGPYYNHNHYAGLMELLFPVSLVIALSRGVRGKWRSVPAFAAIVMIGSIFLSGSRGGMIACLIQLTILGLVVWTGGSRKSLITAAALLISIGILMFWAGGDSLVSRIGSIRQESKSELESGVRLAIDRDGLKMFAARPGLGWGLGTFPVVYPQFRSFFTDKFVNRAHNDYLQLLTETGLAGFAMMLWFVVIVYRAALQKMHDWSWDLNGAVALAAVVGCSGILVHSFVDSNLQIPANAALFYVFCAIAATNTQFGAHRRLHRSHGASECGPAAVPFQP